MTKAMERRSSHSRAINDVVALVGHARPHLADAWDALAVLEASGYTDRRVRRELGLADTRELAELVHAQLSQRPLPPSAGDAAPIAGATSPRVSSTLLLGLTWAVATLASAAALRVPATILPLALIPSVVVCCGFVEAMRRRGAFYAAVGQPTLGRVTCWYFTRLAAFVVAAVTAAGVGIGWVTGGSWPGIALWADEFVIASALWLAAGAVRIPGMLSKREVAPSVPLPRMTVVAFRELPVLLTGAGSALVIGPILTLAANYAAVEIVGASVLTFVLSTLAAGWSARTRRVSLS
jgi:hypothetical protein